MTAMDEDNLPILHIRRSKKHRQPEKGDSLPRLTIQRKRKLSHQGTTRSTSMEVKCFMCGEVNEVEINSFGNFVQRKCGKCGSLFFDDDEDTDEEEDYIEKPPAVVFTPSLPASAPAYQEPARYQPAQGQSRLGRDIQTRQYVDVPQYSRRQGLYISGIQGTGKSVLIENLIIQDIKQNMGVCLLDPHGDLTQAVLSRLPDRRVKDVIYLDMNNYRYPFGINLFQCPDLADLVEVQKTIDQVIHVFEKLLGVSHETPLILEYLQNCTHTLIANPGYTMADIPLLLQDGQCRRKLVANVTDSDVQLFWRLHDQKKPADQSYDIASTLRRVRQFLQPLSRPIVGQSASTIDIRQVMDEGKILLVKLDTTLESITSLIGSLMIALVLNAAKSRADLPVQKRRQFNLYADEFQRFSTEDFATLLEEARKFGVGITIAHQNGSQLETGLKQRARSVANLVVFKVNSIDADELAGEFDITPQEAWEQVLEEEWEQEFEAERLEIREKEWMETIEVIDGEEPIMIISQNPLEHLVEHAHKNAQVNALVKELRFSELVDICNGRIPEGRQQAPSYRYGRIYRPKFEHTYLGNNYRTVEKQYTQGKTLLEELLVDIMEGRQRKEADTCGYKLAEIIKALRGFIGFAQGYGSPQLGQNEDIVELDPQTDALLRRAAVTLLSYNEQTSLIKELADIRIEYHTEWDKPAYEVTTQAWKESWQGKMMRKDSIIVQECVGRAEAEAAIEYLDKLIDLCSLLAEEENHIRISTGQYQPRKRQQIIMHPEKTFAHPRKTIMHPRKTIMHPQRTYADVHNEVASQLTNLPVFTARVKIATDNGSEEHTIKTLDPKKEHDKPLFGQALQDRIDSIKKQNIQDGYVRDRTAVEAEIRQRQEQCSEPPEAEPPISRRSSR
jgi:hypothetical protein